MIKKIFFLLASASFIYGCNTEFSVNGEYVEQPIVHFLLDQGKEYQFLKLNKTFLKEGNSLEFAKEPELSYFDNVVATVKEIKNGSTLREWTLEDTVIQNKKDGVFYGPEQKLYFFKPAALPSNIPTSIPKYLDEDAIYRLNINIDNGNHIVEGQTELVKGVSINSPLQNSAFNFVKKYGGAKEYASTAIVFSLGNGATFKTELGFNYREYTASGNTDKTIKYTLGERSNTDLVGSTSSIFAEGEVFYEVLKNKIQPNSDVTKRTVRGMEITLTAGSSDLYTYMLTNEPTSSLAQNQPTYSNVEGALGIFSSRVTVRQYKPYYNNLNNRRSLDVNSTDELCEGPYTAPFKFCSDIPEDNIRSFSCN
ncbi:hypothetical protein CW751_07570 [Brumimicrobium salinarum]|uniref:DUF4249 domain-containing protein n=1 Tax=Brumimicrobium salinarum TaxID=2058658 RepID=A0A2I0R365_9FLAO|nr:DUF4249 family protein [Brumimicrobium salinarum]PKR81016.1 hypothetical protein CW751_07570 [Brumimicrobium salinarum]